MPLLFSLVKNYETNFEDNTLRRVKNFNKNKNICKV
jgi:hypothetical protein